MIMFDPMYWLFLLPAMVLAGVAAMYTKSTFNRFARVRSRSGLSGAQAAYALLRSQGVDGVEIEPSRGFLSDHYDPTSRTLRLSPQVYNSSSLSAIGVACHEAGHALQHADGYAALGLRSSLVPVANIGSNVAPILFIVGMLFSPALAKLAVFIFLGAVMFTLITLPVEWNASARAKRLMTHAGIVTPDESLQAGKVLNAAFLTYLAAALTAILQLLYFALRAGVLGGSDD